MARLPPDKPDGGMPGSGGFGGGTPPGGSTSSFEYTAATEITEASELTDQTFVSETVDESALIVNTADAVTITNPTVTKIGSSDGGDNCNFYGLNAALLVMGGSTATITGGTIESSASGYAAAKYLPWSVGNEAGGFSNTAAMCHYLKRHSNLPVHYESAVHCKRIVCSFLQIHVSFSPAVICCSRYARFFRSSAASSEAEP